MRELERWDVRAVVAGRAFAARPQLLRALERRYGAPRRVAGIPVFAEYTSTSDRPAESRDHRGRLSPGGDAQPRPQVGVTEQSLDGLAQRLRVAGGTSSPVTPSSIASTRPPTAVATTARESAIASRATTP